MLALKNLYVILPKAFFYSFYRPELDMSYLTSWCLVLSISISFPALIFFEMFQFKVGFCSQTPSVRESERRAGGEVVIGIWQQMFVSLWI